MMTNNNEEDKFLSLTKSAFPRTCPCGKEKYETAQEYLNKTFSINNSHGIKSINDEGERYLEVFRNCVCGSTLLEFFHERREQSDERKNFQIKLDALIAEGFSLNDARKKILSKHSKNNE